MKYHYFVSYNYSNDKQHGFGDLIHIRNNKIKNYEDINDMRESIKETQGFKHLVIINYKLIGTEED